MKLPGRRSSEYQLTLFDPLVYKEGSKRNICGEFVELCTSKFTGAARLKTDSRASICPDLHHRPGVWFECKSVGKTNVVLAYQTRIEKDQRFISNGGQLLYWIWNHSGDIGAATTVGAVRGAIGGTLRAVYVVDHVTLVRLLQGTPLVLNSMYYSNHTTGEFKGSGWKIPIKALCDVSNHIGVVPAMSVRGVFVRSVPLYATCPMPF